MNFLQIASIRVNRRLGPAAIVTHTKVDIHLDGEVMGCKAIMRATAMALAGGIMTACGGSTTAVADDGVSGTYKVSAINGAPPPAVISQNSQRTISLVGATFQIGSDGRFTLDDTLTVAVTGQGSGQQTDHRTGTYVVSGTKVTFTPDQVGLLTVTSLDRSGSGLTLTHPSGSVPVVIVFRKS